MPTNTAATSTPTNTPVVTAITATPTLVGPGTKTCLTGTDPSVANDVSQITVVREQIDTQCPCAVFDGSTGKTHAAYVKCAKTVIASAVAQSNLRSACKATVTRYYSKSVCGRNPNRQWVPCVKTSARGRVTCAISTSARCVGPGKAACPAATTCVDAADTNGDGLIGAGDSGSCRTKRIFASSQLLEPGYPNYVYPEGADARCQQLASAVAALNGSQFKALICGASPDVAGGTPLGIRDRFSPSPGGYIDRLGNPIAHSLDDLLDGTISNTITIDENATPIVIGGGREYAWTGCQANGAPNPPAYLCQSGAYSWTTGHVGTTGGKGYLLSTSGGSFLDAQLEACNAPLHLICVEQ